MLVIRVMKMMMNHYEDDMYGGVTRSPHTLKPLTTLEHFFCSCSEHAICNQLLHPTNTTEENLVREKLSYSRVNILAAMSRTSQSIPATRFSPVTALHGRMYQWWVLRLFRSRICHREKHITILKLLTLSTLSDPDLTVMLFLGSSDQRAFSSYLFLSLSCLT